MANKTLADLLANKIEKVNTSAQPLQEYLSFYLRINTC